jgi:hypothetical protein
MRTEVSAFLADVRRWNVRVAQQRHPAGPDQDGKPAAIDIGNLGDRSRPDPDRVQSLIEDADAAVPLVLRDVLHELS